MIVFKNILTFICCAPFLAFLIWLCEVILDWLGDVMIKIDNDSSILIQIILMPIMGLIVLIVPLIVGGLGLLLWVIAEMLFGLG